MIESPISAPSSPSPAGVYLPLAGGTLTGTLNLPPGTDASPSLQFGTAGTGLYSPSSVGIGMGFNDGYGTGIVFESVSGSGAPYIIGYSYQGATTGFVGYSAGGTAASPTALSNSEGLITFHAYGYDGSAYQSSAACTILVSGTVSSGIVPSKMTFYTTNTSGTFTRALTLANDQSVNVGSGGSTKVFDDLGNFYCNGFRADLNTSYQALSTGFSITLSSAIAETVNTNTATLAAGTITLPASPTNGQIFSFVSCGVITSLTVSPSAGQSVVGAPSSIAIDGGFKMKYRSSNTTWYPSQG